MAQPTDTIQLPILQEKEIVTIYSQIRPYREGGFRIEAQNVKNKLVIHNYGHGGSGVSLSYGSALRALQCFERANQNPHGKCAVLGCGIMGLTTALVLVERGFQVTIYSEKFPEFGEKRNQKMITSQIAPGFWFPYDYLQEKNLDLLSIAQKTIEYLKGYSLNKKQKSVRLCQTYDNIYAQEILLKLKNVLPNRTISNKKIDFGSGASQNMHSFQTFKIDMQIWIKEIMSSLQAKGVNYIQRSFSSLQDVLSLDQKNIFNCLGFQAGIIFGEKKMKALRGHIVEFSNPNPAVYNYIFGTKVDGRIIRLYCHNERILLGLSKEQTQKIQIDTKTVNELLESYQKLYQQWAEPKPKL